MREAQSPTKAVQITGPRAAIERALEQGLLSDARFHSAHGLSWIEVSQISRHAEDEMQGSGCSVHRKTAQEPPAN